MSTLFTEEEDLASKIQFIYAYYDAESRNWPPQDKIKDLIAEHTAKATTDATALLRTLLQYAAPGSHEHRLITQYFSTKETVEHQTK